MIAILPFDLLLNIDIDYHMTFFFSSCVIFVREEKPVLAL